MKAALQLEVSFKLAFQVGPFKFAGPGDLAASRPHPLRHPSVAVFPRFEAEVGEMRGNIPRHPPTLAAPARAGPTVTALFATVTVSP